MAEAGAWQSGVYDNGRDFHHGEKGPATGVPATMYNPTVSMGRSKEGAAWTITSITLRCVTVLCTTIAVAIIASNKGSEWVYCPDDGSTHCVSYWSALANSNIVYLFAIDVIVCFYCIVQLILSIVSVCTGKPVLKGPLSPAATTTFICDQILTYLLMCGCGVGAAAATVLRTTGWTCDYFKSFCDKNHASLAMSFIAFLCIALSAGIAYFRLYRLRG